MKLKLTCTKISESTLQFGEHVLWHLSYLNWWFFPYYLRKSHFMQLLLLVLVLVVVVVVVFHYLSWTNVGFFFSILALQVWQGAEQRCSNKSYWFRRSVSMPKIVSVLYYYTVFIVIMIGCFQNHAYSYLFSIWKMLLWFGEHQLCRVKDADEFFKFSYPFLLYGW